MKSIYLTLSLVCVLSFLNAKAQNFEWARSSGGSLFDRGNSISVDALGNIYTTGFFTGSVDFDPGTGTQILNSSGSSRDIFIQKLDASGNFLWAKSFGSSQFDEGSSIAVDALGNVYTTGYFEGTVDFDPGSGTTNLTATWGDIFIQKLDASGNFIWAKSFSFGGSQFFRLPNITLDAFGNIYTTGYFQGTEDFDPGAGTTNLTAAGDFDVFIQKLDTSSNFQWAKSFGARFRDRGGSIKVDASGNVYTTGYFSDRVDFDPGAGITNLTAAGNKDIFIQKLDFSGNFIWAKSFGGSGVDEGKSIAIDALGNVYSTGFFEGTVDFNPGTRSLNLTSAGLKDIYIQKLDPSGNFLWANSLGDTLDDLGGGGIALDLFGNIYTTGGFRGTPDFDPGAGTTNLTSAGHLDVFIQKLDASGNFVWAKSFGDSFADQALSITVDNNGSLYTTGYFHHTVDFDPGAGNNNLTSAGAGDVFVQKINQSSTTGIMELTPGIEVEAFPNPTNGLVEVAFTQAFQNVEITLTDLQGKEVFYKVLNATANEQIEIEGSPGVYLLTIRTEKGQSVIKLIKE